MVEAASPSTKRDETAGERLKKVEEVRIVTGVKSKRSPEPDHRAPSS